MPIILNEQRMLEENMFNYEERVNSPLSRFADKSYTPVEYYHINNRETTADAGFQDIEEILGERSPIRFGCIHNFPLYGIESIVLELSETDIGLDSTYESEATILPGTIEPYPNDYFTIKSLNDNYIFRITEVHNDAVMAEGYYSINFTLEYIDKEKQEDLDNQTVDKFTCVIDNIGTDEKCIIEDEYYEDIQKINSMYSEMVNNYLTFFYSKKYNCLLGDLDENFKLFDPLQCEFIMKHQLFKMKNQLDNIVLNSQFEDNMRKIKYENSIYRLIETKNLAKLSQFQYFTFYGIDNKQTAFARWHAHNVKILDIASKMDPDSPVILSEDTVETIRKNYETDSKYLRLLSDFIHRNDISVREIDLSLGEELLVLRDSNLEVFFFTPIILYIIKTIVNSQIKKRDDGINR